MTTSPRPSAAATIESAFSAGAQTDLYGYESILSTVEWQAHSVDPITPSLYRELQFLTDFSERSIPSLAANMNLAVGASSERNVASDPELGDWTATPTNPERIGRIVRAMTPRECARCTHLYPYLTTRGTIGTAWRLAGLGVVLEPTVETRSTR